MAGNETTITVEDLAAALVGFAVSLASAQSSMPETPNELLSRLATELDDLSRGSGETAAAATMQLAARMLIASEPSDDG